MGVLHSWLSSLSFLKLKWKQGKIKERKISYSFCHVNAAMGNCAPQVMRLKLQRLKAGFSNLASEDMSALFNLYSSLSLQKAA